MIIGEAFIREKQSLFCLKNPDNTCVCGHYEPLNKRSILTRTQTPELCLQLLVQVAQIGPTALAFMQQVQQAGSNRFSGGHRGCRVCKAIEVFGEGARVGAASEVRKLM
jgi:hypothetical protein